MAAVARMHMFTAKETRMDEVARPRNRWSRKLTPDQVIELRRLRSEGWTYRALSRKFGITLGGACHCCLRRTWAHV